MGPTDTAVDAAKHILDSDMALRSSDSIPDVCAVVDNDPKFTSNPFREFMRRIGSSLIIGSAFHKHTNAKVERVHGVLGDAVLTYTNG